MNASEHFDLAKKKEATRQVLDGLHELHRLLRIHRDIKPNNILVQSLQPLNLVIGDFGQVSLSDLLSLVGTDIYRAPEIWINASTECHHSFAVDIFSVGMLIIWLLALEVVGGQIEYQQLWTQDQYNKYVGFKIEAAIKRNARKEVREALVAAQTMAQWDPEKTPSAAECLQLKWWRPTHLRRSARNRTSVNRFDPFDPIRPPKEESRARRSNTHKSRARHESNDAVLEGVEEGYEPMDLDSR